ncbi:MAG: PAS domain S-box protein [Syntrophorhabdus sp.]
MRKNNLICKGKPTGPDDNFRIAIEHSNDGVAIMQGNRHVYVNQKFLDMFGYKSIEEVIGKTHDLTVHPDDYEMVTEYNRWRQKGNHQVPSKYEFKGIQKNGAIIYIEASSAAITYNGEPASLAYLRDITERKRSEVMLMESEKRYRNLVENALVGVYQTNLDGDVLYLNNTCLHMLGFATLEDAKSGGSPSFYKNREDRKLFLEFIKQNKKVSNYEVEFVTHSGYPLHILLSATLESDTITGMMMDITEHKQKDLALQESEARYRLLAENVSDIILMMDMDLNFTYISPSIERLRGPEPGHVPLRSLRDALTASSYDVVINVFLEEIAKEHEGQSDPFRFRVLELEYVRYDGTTRWVEVKASFLRNADGLPTNILCVVRDITHRKEAEKELKMKSLRLEEVNTALKVLLEQREKDRAELEDNILLNVRKLILPYVESLKQRHLDEEQKIYLDVLETNLQNIVSPFAKKLTLIQERLTPAEIRVADFIRDGKTVKEIAGAFGISESAINVHRHHIRSKLGLTNRKINLRTYLLSLGK